MTWASTRSGADGGFTLSQDETIGPGETCVLVVAASGHDSATYEMAKWCTRYKEDIRGATLPDSGAPVVEGLTAPRSGADVVNKRICAEGFLRAELAASPVVDAGEPDAGDPDAG
jgi:hypothetical protein